MKREVLPTLDELWRTYRSLLDNQRLAPEIANLGEADLKSRGWSEFYSFDAGRASEHLPFVIAEIRRCGRGFKRFIEIDPDDLAHRTGGIKLILARELNEAERQLVIGGENIGSMKN